MVERILSSFSTRTTHPWSQGTARHGRWRSDSEEQRPLLRRQHSEVMVSLLLDVEENIHLLEFTAHAGRYVLPDF